MSDIIWDGLMLLTNLTISPRPGQNSNVAYECRVFYQVKKGHPKLSLTYIKKLTDGGISKLSMPILKNDLCILQ